MAREIILIKFIQVKLEKGEIYKRNGTSDLDLEFGVKMSDYLLSRYFYFRTLFTVQSERRLPADYSECYCSFRFGFLFFFFL